jgi:hypothetical protein
MNNKMIYICLKDGQTVKLDTIPVTAANLSTSSSLSTHDLSSVDSNDSYDSDYSLISSSTSQIKASSAQDQSDGVKIKRKRQRLTHLTQEEKIMRRKMKNREAAQSARDRKKAKMDELDVSVSLLQEQNEKLRLENSLLKEQNRLLAQENKNLKQRLAVAGNSGRHVEVERSAESSNVTQPKVQLQQKQPLSYNSRQAALFQRLIYVLIVQTLSLLKVVPSGSPFHARLVSMKDSLIRLDQQCALPGHCNSLLSSPKLKAGLIKLVKLMRLLRHHRPESSQSALVKAHKQPLLLSEQHMKLMLLVSLMVKSLGTTPAWPKRTSKS